MNDHVQQADPINPAALENVVAVDVVQLLQQRLFDLVLGDKVRHAEQFRISTL